MSAHNHNDANLDIPLEIIELIMEELATDEDMKTLKTCSLACSTFRFICQQRIFATIDLNFSRRPFKNPLAHRFRRLVDRNPSIANYVRSLNYVEVYDSKRGAPVLRRFSRVNSFTFGFNDLYSSSQKDWDKMTMSLKTSLCYFIHANNIVDLHLFNIKNLPISLLLHFPALTSLEIGHVDFLDSSLPVIFPDEEVVPMLSSIAIQSGSLFTIWHLLGSEFADPVIDLRQLEELAVCIDDEPNGMELVNHILKTTQNIKTLNLIGHSPTLTCLGNIASALSPESLKTLKTIRLTPVLESADEDPYFDLTKELEEISGRNVLEEIIFDIAIQTDHKCTTDPLTWGQLDETLSMGFPFLRRVEVKVTYWSCCSGENEEFLERMWDIGRNKFSRLEAANQIEFTFDAEVEIV